VLGDFEHVEVTGKRRFFVFQALSKYVANIVSLSPAAHQFLVGLHVLIYSIGQTLMRYFSIFLSLIRQKPYVFKAAVLLE
jgi:hypothetical protein